MDSHTWWYLARASGIVAWALTTAAVLWGLSVSGRLLRKKPKPGWLLDLHEFLGALAVVFTAVHVVGLLGDATVSFRLVDVLVPFASSWRPAAVAAGVVAAWLLVAVQGTSVLRRRLPRRVWRWTHTASVPLWVLATLHLALAGHDSANPAVAGAVVVATAAVVFAGAYRLLARPVRRPRRSPGGVST